MLAKRYNFKPEELDKIISESTDVLVDKLKVE